MKYGFAPLALLGWTLLSTPSARAAWVLQNPGTSVDLNAVNFDHSTENRAWACGDQGTILYTSDGGANWVLQNSGTTADLYGIVFHEENGCIIAVGEHGTILRTTDRGTTWSQRPSPTTRTLRDTSDFRFYAVGDSGTIIKSGDGGLTWAAMDSGTDTDLRSVIGLEPLPTVAGAGGLILRGNPQGTIWNPLNSGTTTGLNGVPLFSTQLVAGDGGTILRSTNNGASWLPVASGTNRSLRSIGDANGAIYVVGAGGTIVKSSDNGATWGVQATPTVQDLNGTFFYLFPHIGYAVGDGGTILKTTDGGGPIVTAVDESRWAAAIRLQPATPNPFHAETSVTYMLGREAHVSLRVFDCAGRVVASLTDARRRPGTHSVTWDATGVAAGVYACRLEADGAVRTRRLVLVR